MSDSNPSYLRLSIYFVVAKVLGMVLLGFLLFPPCFSGAQEIIRYEGWRCNSGIWIIQNSSRITQLGAVAWWLLSIYIIWFSLRVSLVVLSGLLLGIVLSFFVGTSDYGITCQVEPGHFTPEFNTACSAYSSPPCMACRY